jgi:hypothetical protein
MSWTTEASASTLPKYANTYCRTQARSSVREAAGQYILSGPPSSYRGVIMPIRLASCSCGQLTALTNGDPVRTSICHCLACQRRTGSPFAEQARFFRADVTVAGQSTSYIRTGDEGASALSLLSYMRGDRLLRARRGRNVDRDSRRRIRRSGVPGAHSVCL